MTLDLKRVFADERAALPISYQLDLSHVPHAGGFPLKKPVSVRGSVVNRASVVTLRLQISYAFSAPCDRCGAETEREYALTVERALVLATEGEESDGILAVPDMQLDLDDLVYTEVCVDLPTKFLCRDDCLGLCPQCGKNRNDGPCGCRERELDPRWAALAELLDQ